MSPKQRVKAVIDAFLQTLVVTTLRFDVAFNKSLIDVLDGLVHPIHPPADCRSRRSRFSGFGPATMPGKSSASAQITASALFGEPVPVYPVVVSAQSSSSRRGNSPTCRTLPC